MERAELTEAELTEVLTPLAVAAAVGLSYPNPIGVPAVRSAG
jgi:hypothetical protein